MVRGLLRHRFSVGLAAIAAAVLVLWSAPRVADAADDDRAKVHWKRGAELYEAGDHAGAIREWEEGYVLSERPEFLVNIAQSYRELGDLEQALYYYRLYLKKKPDAKDAAEVRDIIKTLERETGGSGGSGGGDGDGTDGRGDRGDRTGRHGDDGDDGGGDGDDPRRTMSPEEERMRVEMGGSYDAWVRSGLTPEGFRRARVGTTLMIVGGVTAGAGVVLVVALASMTPMESPTGLEKVGYTSGVIAAIGGALLVYWGWATWRSGHELRRAGAALPGRFALGLAPLEGGALVTAGGRFP